jgi:hypothetical protein
MQGGYGVINEWFLGFIGTDKTLHLPFYGGICLPVNVRNISSDGEYVAVCLNQEYIMNHGVVKEFRLRRIKPGPYNEDEALSMCDELCNALYLKLEYKPNTFPAGRMHKHPNYIGTEFCYTRKALWPKVCNMYNRGFNFDYVVLSVPLEELHDIPFLSEEWLLGFGKFPMNKKLLA